MIIDFRSKNGGGGGTGGTTNYNELENKPSLNGTTLQGNVTMPIPSKTSDLTNDSDFVNSTALDNEKTRAEQAEEVLDGKIVANTEAIQNKADKSTTYTKDEVDAALSNKADASDITDIDSKLQSKADSSDVNAIAESLSTTQEIVAQKANIGDSYTKAESDAKYLTEHQDISGKQDVITDLETIREGAALGATAIQEHQSLAEYAKTADVAATYQPKGDYITEETDPVWNAEKGNYYTKDETDAEVSTVKSTAQEAYNIASSARYQLDYKSDKSEVYTKNEIYTKTEVDAKIADVELYKFPNVTLFGEPSINGGQLSNFSATNYAQFPFLVDLRKPFEINFCVTPIDWDREQENIIDSDFGLAIAIRNNVFVIAMSSNGTSWNLGEHTGNWWATPNMTNYCKFSWDGSQYKLEVSNNPSEWGYSTDIVIDSTESLYPKTIVIGKGVDNTHIFTGSINLNYCNLSIDGNIVWNGMDDAGLATRLATDMSNIDAEGVNKVKEIATDIPLKSINGESIKGDGNIEIGGTGDAYTKAESDALLDNKTNTNLDNISDEGKENLKNMFKGSKTNLWNVGELSHTITSDEAAQKWYINYDAEIFKRVGMIQLSTIQGDWSIYHNSSNTVTFNCTGTTQGIEVYDKATDAKLSSDADMSLTVPENSFYIKFNEGLDIATNYFGYMSEVFYSGDAPLYEETDPVWNKEKTNYFTKNDSYSIFASKSDLNNYSSSTQVNTALANKADSNLSNASLKTINGQSLKGMGDITIKGGDEHFKFNPEEDIVNGIAVYTKDEKLITIENKNEPIPMGTAYKFDMDSIDGTKYLMDSIGFWTHIFDASEEKLTISREMMYYEPNPLNIYKDGELVAKIASTEEGGVRIYEISFSEVSHYTFKPMCTVMDNWNFQDSSNGVIPFVKPTLILGSDDEGAYVVRNSVKKEIATTDNYAELHFFDENDNETTLLLLKKN